MKFNLGLFFVILCYSLNINAQSLASIKPIANNFNTGKTLIENKGQWPKGVVFRANMDGGKLWVLENKMIFHLQDYSAMHKAHAMKTPGFTGETIKETVVHLNFVGSKKAKEIKKYNPTDFYYNYFIGADQSKWASDVHGYESAVMKEFYSGIDFKITGQGDEVKYEFIVNPQVDPSVIKLNYAGQNSLKIDRKGNLVIDTELGKIFENKPYAYQVIEGQKKEVAVKFVLNGDNVTFDLGKYNPNYNLIIDPVLVFATYNGANSDNFGMTATYGHDGTAYSGGTVYGNNFPTPDNQTYDVNSNFTVLNGSYGVTDVFITKYNPTGTQMLWSTFIGGGNNNAGTETVHSMICDLNDNLYFFGATSSADFPTTASAFDQTHNGGGTAEFYYNGVYYSSQGTDIYVAKLSTNGHNLLGSTFVGGSLNDGVNYTAGALPYNSANSYSGLTSNYGDQFRGEIMLDQNNNILVASCTKSTNFPVASAIQGTNGGGQDGVVFKLAANFQSLLFSSYYGGSADDACYSVKVDDFDNIIFAGGTKSTNLIATTGGWQPANAGGTADGFVVKLPPTGNNITQASYIGRNQYDQVFFVEVDRDNNIFLLGQSVGGTFPVVNAAYSNGNSSNFIIKLNSALTTNMASTRFGNGSTSINVSPAAFLVDICGNIYVSAWGANILQNTPISGMPVTPDAFRLTPPNGFDFYLLVLKRDFGGILYGTYIGGNQSEEHVDGGTSRFDKNGIVYQSVCAGCGNHDDFPTTPGAWSATNNSNNCNNAIYKFDTGVIPNAEFTTDQVAGCQNFTVTFDNSSSDDDSFLWDFGNGNVDSVTVNPVITYDTPGTYQVNLYVTDSFCLIVDTARVTITVLDSIRINLPDTLKLCNSNPTQLIANSYGTGDYFIWSTSPNFTNPLNIPADSVITVVPPGTKYYIKVGNQYCSKIDSVVVIFDVPPTAEITINNQQGCAPLTVTLTNSSVQTNYFLWNFGNGVLDSVNNTTSVTYTTPGTYQISLTIVDDVCPANDVATVTVTVTPGITINLVDTIALCTSVPITFNPTVAGGATTFIWSSNNQFSDTLNSNLSQADLTINDPSTGYYYFYSTNGDCENKDSVYVDFTSASLSLSGDNLICLGETTTISATSSNPNITFTYTWTPAAILVSPTTSNQVQVSPTTSQYLYLSASSSNGCFIEDSIFINVSSIDPSTVVASASQTIVAPGTTVVLSGIPSGMSSYSWTPTTGLATPNAQTTNALVNESTIYTLTVSDGICDVSDTVEVKVYTIICEDPYVFIPNAFTPNGDNNNDVLYVRGIWIEKMIFRVFDRWGELVFESTDPNYGWDGVFRGKKLDPDVYDYYLDVTCIGGLQSITKGNVTLMK
ncbi:MAG: PKD domain-containing protein [Flavobacteriales bacterium]|nr:PKD domain-containing protein [Flavobacteriales bacterium]